MKNQIPHERSGKFWVTMMETFLDHAGWDHIGDAAASANGNFLAEYTTGVETPGNAGVGKAHSGRAARAARDGAERPPQVSLDDPIRKGRVHHLDDRCCASTASASK